MMPLLSFIKVHYPAENVLSSIWENLFVEMARGRYVEELLVEKLKTITPADARVLLSFESNRYIFSRKGEVVLCLERMATNGITKKIIAL